MAAFEYKVVFMDFRGRASIEGDETFIEKNERRSSFARRVMNELGGQGWDLVGIQQLWPAETSYLIFKREKSAEGAQPETSNTQRLPSSGEDAETLEPRGPVQDL